MRVVAKNVTQDYGEFVAEPFERGFGHTIGNSLRRVLLSAIEGSAITCVKIEGVKHEFSSLPGILEDVCDIILNVKKIRLSINDGPTAKLLVDVDKKGEVTAGDIQSKDNNVTVHNKGLVLATLAVKTHFRMEMEARRGRGYLTADENAREPQELGVIPIASIFSPIRHVRYKIENTRVGKITNYDRILLSIRTDGTIAPDMALVEASKILRKHLNPFIQYFELGKEVAEDKKIPAEQGEKAEKLQENIQEQLEFPIDHLKLGVRASNCLSSEGIRTIRDLVGHTEADLLRIRNFGKTSLNEIKIKLQKLNLSLGMPIPE